MPEDNADHQMAKLPRRAKYWLYSAAGLLVYGWVASSAPSFDECVNSRREQATQDGYAKYPENVAQWASMVLRCQAVTIEENDVLFLALFTALLGASTTGLWIQTARLAHGAEEQSKDMKRSLEISSQIANANSQSADISKKSMLASQRAYVHFSGCNWISHRQFDNRKAIFWRIAPTWINSGNTPTKSLIAYVKYELRDSALNSDYEFVAEQNTTYTESFISPHGSIGSSPYDISAEDLDKVARGQKFLYIWGFVKYRDVFEGTRMHVCKFCVFAANVTGVATKEFDKETNPVHITWATYDKHNVSDEEVD